MASVQTVMKQPDYVHTDVLPLDLKRQMAQMALDAGVRIYFVQQRHTAGDISPWSDLHETEPLPRPPVEVHIVFRMDDRLGTKSIGPFSVRTLVDAMALPLGTPIGERAYRTMKPVGLTRFMQDALALIGLAILQWRYVNVGDVPVSMGGDDVNQKA